MVEKNRTGRLNIIEPWEFGTEKSIAASIVDKNEEQYLLYLPEPLWIKGKAINYLIGELRDKNLSDILSDKVHGTFALNMIYSNDVTIQNFRGYQIKDFRGNFLLGEIIFEKVSP
jgi:hypothetical protein